MRGSKYVVISRNEDGGHHVAVLDRDEFVRRITPDLNGQRYYGGDRFPIRFVKTLEEVKDGSTLLVISGEAVIPKPVEIVTKYDLSE